jgi:carbon starvation protein
LAWAILAYGFAASVLPVWLLLAPRDYLSTFMKLGTIFALALGIFFVLPNLRMPAVTKFIDGTGLVVPGKLFPFCFITIACGAISGFHTLISSGTTPKIISRESYARPIGYGAMCLESLVAIMAIIAACTLSPSVYLGMNIASAGADSQSRAASVTQKIRQAGADFTVTAEEMDRMATEVNEKTLFNRAGGAATLAVGMANIFSQTTKGRWLDLWYHFAIMFEALFILTTLDAGTRVGRYILQDFLGNIHKPLGDTKNFGANVLASALMVCGWGYFLIQGVRDPLGGINSLWPLFGIANQMLAAIALCLATTIILKMQLGSAEESKVQSPKSKVGRPALMLITLVPLLWLLAVTFTAGVQKIFHADPRIGFLAQAKVLGKQIETTRAAVVAAQTDAEYQKASKEMNAAVHLYGNQIIDALVAGIFLILVTVVVLFSLREWILLLARKKVVELRESPPVWLPDYAIAEARPLHAASLIALGFALAKELSGEAQLERAQKAAQLCECTQHEEKPRAGAANAVVAKTGEQIYLEVTEERFKGVRRCC